MPGICRLGDNDSGHSPCFPPRQNTEGSPNVMVDNKPVHRLGDSWAIHCCSSHGCHGATTVTASTSVIINGKGAARIGDKVSCGSIITQGSSTVIIG